MAIIYNRLWETLKAKGLNENYLRKNGISPSILAKIKNGTGGLDARTIDKVCTLLDCRVEDIMEHVPTAPTEVLTNGES